MFKFKPFLYLMALVLCFGVLGMNGMLQGAGKKIVGDKKSVADTIINSSGINWIPRMSYEQLILSVSRPDGSVLRRTFENNSSPYIDLSAIVGNSSECDGLYTYELRLVSVDSKKMRDQLRDQRKKNQNSSIIEGAQAEKPIIQTGYFTVKGGMVITPSGMPEKTGNIGKDVYSTEAAYNEDLVVTGNLCVGASCSDPESYGEENLKLKDANIRILFDDTSATSAFPANDWSIVINDIDDGGANYFAVKDETADQTPFRIEAGAPENSLYIEDYGRVGLKTSTPAVELHIVDGDSPALRLEQDTSSGWTAQAWDIAGNETNFFIRDVTNSSKLPFRIQPGAPTDSLVITKDGRLGIGTLSPIASFDMQRTGSNSVVVFQRVGGAMGKFTARPNEVYIGSGSSHNVQFVANNNILMTLTPTGYTGIGMTTPSHLLDVGNSGAYCNGGAWIDGSSRKYKENIIDLSLDEARKALFELNPVKFRYKSDKEEESLGFIAEDVPELVATKDRKGMSAMDVVAVLTKMVQDQQKTIAELQEKVAKLEKEKQ